MKNTTLELTDTLINGTQAVQPEPNMFLIGLWAVIFLAGLYAIIKFIRKNK